MLEATNQTLSAYEDFMATVATTIGSYPVHPSQLSLTRIFSKGSFDLGVDFPGFARHQIALESNSRRGVYERQTIYRRV